MSPVSGASRMQDPDNLDKALKAFNGVKKGAIAVAIIILVYNVGVLLGWEGDRASSASGSFHVITMFFTYVLADAGARLARLHGATS